MIRRFRQAVAAVFVLAVLGPCAWLSAQPTTAQQETARDAWQKVPEILAALEIGPDAVVADVGAGGGFLTARLARAVGPGGRVFAVDVDVPTVERLRGRVQTDALTNVTVIKGDASDPHLGAASLDAAVIINAYHEMPEHQAMFQHLRAALKPGGRLVIIEPISDKRLTASREQQIPAHEIAARFVEQEAREAGFRIRTLRDPFVNRPDRVAEWLIVAVPDGNFATEIAESPAAADEASLASPDLRIAVVEFKKRHAAGSIAVVDVRSEEEYVAGHIPGAIWIQLSDLNAHVEQLRALRKPIVTYCS